MDRNLDVQSDEVSPIQGYDGSIIRNCKLKDCVVRNSSSRVAGVQTRQNIVSEAPQLHNRRQRKVLLGVKSSHGQAASLSAI